MIIIHLLPIHHLNRLCWDTRRGICWSDLNFHHLENSRGNLFVKILQAQDSHSELDPQFFPNFYSPLDPLMIQDYLDSKIQIIGIVSRSEIVFVRKLLRYLLRLGLVPVGGLIAVGLLASWWIPRFIFLVLFCLSTDQRPVVRWNASMGWFAHTALGWKRVFHPN